jgi:hypothetical protein
LRDVVADAPVEKGASLVDSTEDAVDVLGAREVLLGLVLDGFKQEYAEERKAGGVVPTAPVQTRASLVDCAQYAIDARPQFRFSIACRSHRSQSLILSVFLISDSRSYLGSLGEA